jgi:hypothetical protein
MSVDLLALPWQVQLTLASGYAAYALAYSGIRAHHQTIDVAFATLVFGLVATGVFNGLTWSGRVEPIAASAIAFFFNDSCGLGLEETLTFACQEIVARFSRE